jgi:hypothetical protein
LSIYLNKAVSDCNVSLQYSTVHIPNVFYDGDLQIISCVGIVRTPCFSSHHTCTETLITCIYSYKEVQANQNSNTVAPDRPQRDRPTICVITQQYSSSTFGRITLPVTRGKNWVLVQIILVQLFIL